MAMAAATMKGHEELFLEVTVLSAESLKNPSSPLLPGSRRLRPYVVLSCAEDAANTNYHRQQQQQQEPLYRTRVDEDGANNPAWDDVIRLAVHPSFLCAATPFCGARNEDARGAGVLLTVLSRRAFRRHPARLGWCRISPSDVLDGVRPASMKRRLSYALRSPQHGGRGHGVVHVAVRLVGAHLDLLAAPPAPGVALGWGRQAVGIPVALPNTASAMVPLFAQTQWTFDGAGGRIDRA